MTFKTFLAEATILEGGAAIKGSHPLTQAEAREISMHAIRDLKDALGVESSQISVVGSAGLKAPDQLSGDIDIAVMADITAVKTAVEQLALDGRFRHMPGLNVFSYAKLHGSKTAQIDVIPTTNIKLAKWAYYNDPADLKLGLKGSHRNELLFAIAKFAEYVSTAKDANGEDSARERLVFDLSRGLYRFIQDRAGKRGLTKSFATRDKKLITSDPDQICERLFGKGVGAKQVLTFNDALKLMLSSSFKHKSKLKQILERAVAGLEQKKLAVPHELRIVSVKEALEPSIKSKILKLQQEAIDHGFDYELEAMNEHVLKRHNAAIIKKFPAYKPSTGGFRLDLDDDFIDEISVRFEKEAEKQWRNSPPDDDDGWRYKPRRYHDDDDYDPPTPPEFPLENVATMITVADDGATVAWCHQTVLQTMLDINKLNVQSYIIANADLANDQVDESLHEGVDRDILQLQQKLIDDLANEFDISIGNYEPYGKAMPGQRRHREGEQYVNQYVKLDLLGISQAYIYMAPSLVNSHMPNYTMGLSNELLTYEELLEMIEERFMYWLDKLDRLRKDKNENS